MLIYAVMVVCCYMLVCCYGCMLLYARMVLAGGWCCLCCPYAYMLGCLYACVCLLWVVWYGVLVSMVVLWCRMCVLCHVLVVYALSPWVARLVRPMLSLVALFLLVVCLGAYAVAYVLALWLVCCVTGICDRCIDDMFMLVLSCSLVVECRGFWNLKIKMKK